MKKIAPLLCFISISTISVGQQNSEAKLSADDSICVKKAMAMIKQIKAEGENAKYYKDDEFLINLSRSNSKDNENRVRVLNFGNDKVLSVTILEIRVAAYDSAGTVSIVLLNTPMDLIKEQKMEHCNSLSVNLGKIGLSSTVKSEIKQIKVKLSYSGKDVIAKMGADE